MFHCHTAPQHQAHIFLKVPFYISHTSVWNVLSYKFPKIICTLFSLFCNRIISLKWFWNLAKFFYLQFVSRKEKLQNVLQLSPWIRNSLRICFLPGNLSSKIKFQQKGNRLFIKQSNITFFDVSQNNFYIFFYIYILFENCSLLYTNYRLCAAQHHYFAFTEEYYLVFCIQFLINALPFYLRIKVRHRYLDLDCKTTDLQAKGKPQIYKVKVITQIYRLKVKTDLQAAAKYTDLQTEGKNTDLQAAAKYTDLQAEGKNTDLQAEGKNTELYAEGKTKFCRLTVISQIYNLTVI